MNLNVFLQRKNETRGKKRAGTKRVVEKEEGDDTAFRLFRGVEALYWISR